MAVFTLGGASARHFQEQQRIGTTQRSVRMAMDRLRRDIARAGYLSVPDTRSNFVRMCPMPATPRRVQAIWFQNDDPVGAAALGAINGSQNGVSADKLRLTGNYATADQYLVRSMNTSGNMIYLQTDWLGFRRSFVTTNGGTSTVNVNRFNDVFQAGRMLHIESPNGYHYVVRITSSFTNSTGIMAYVTVSPGLGADNPCLPGLGRGAVVSPISEIEYYVAQPTGTSNLIPRNQDVTGANTVLFRHELNMANQTELAGSARPVLEYAVDFNLDFVIDTNLNRTLPPILARQTGALAQSTVQNNAWQVRSVIASLAARTPEQDRRFPWPDIWAGGRPATAPLNRYRVFPGRDGAARVRQLRTEIQMPNLVPR